MQLIINQRQLSANSTSIIGQVESKLNTKIWYTTLPSAALSDA